MAYDLRTTEEAQSKERTDALAHSNTEDPGDHAAGYGGIGLLRCNWGRC